MPRRSRLISVDELDRLKSIEAAAVALIEAIDRNLVTRPWKFKYDVPFGEALRLRKAIEGRKLTCQESLE